MLWISVERPNQIDELGGGALPGWPVQREGHSGTLCGPALVAHVDRGGRIVATEHHCE